MISWVKIVVAGCLSSSVLFSNDIFTVNSQLSRCTVSDMVVSGSFLKYSIDYRLCHQDSAPHTANSPTNHAACWTPIHSGSADYSFSVYLLPSLSIVSLMRGYNGSTNKRGSICFRLRRNEILLERWNLAAPYPVWPTPVMYLLIPFMTWEGPIDQSVIVSNKKHYLRSFFDAVMGVMEDEQDVKFDMDARGKQTLENLCCYDIKSAIYIGLLFGRMYHPWP